MSATKIAEILEHDRRDTRRVDRVALACWVIQNMNAGQDIDTTLLAKSIILKALQDG